MQETNFCTSKQIGCSTSVSGYWVLYPERVRPPSIYANWASLFVGSFSYGVWIFRVRTLTQAICYPSLRKRDYVFEKSRADRLSRCLQCFMCLVRRSCKFRRHLVRQIPGRERVLPLSVPLYADGQFSLLVTIITKHHSPQIEYQLVIYVSRSARVHNRVYDQSGRRAL